MSRWFRFYDTAIDDPKVQRLPDPLFKTWINMLCLASQNGGELPAFGDMAFKLRLSEEETQARFDALIEAGLIDIGDAATPHNWSDRQFKSDVSTDRVKRFRSGQRNVSATVSETPPETETEADTEQKEKPRALEKEFEVEFWQAWPNKVGKPAALKSYLRARKTHELAAIMAGLQFYATNKPPDREWLNPATFLNQERFLDKPAQRSALPAGASKSPVVDRHVGKAWCSDSSELYRAWEAQQPKYVKMITEDRGEDRGAWLPPLPDARSLGLKPGEAA